MALWNIPIADCWYMLSESTVTRVTNSNISGPTGSASFYKKIRRYLKVENKSSTEDTKFFFFAFLEADESNAMNDWDVVTFQVAMRSNVSAWRMGLLVVDNFGSVSDNQVPSAVLSSMNTGGTDPSLVSGISYASGSGTDATVSTSWADYYISNAYTDTEKNIGVAFWSNSTLTQDDYIEFGCPMIYRGTGPRRRAYPAMAASRARSEMEFQRSQNPEHLYGSTTEIQTPYEFTAASSTQYIHVPFRTQMLYNPSINIYSPNSGTSGYIYGYDELTDFSVYIEESNKNGFTFSTSGLTSGYRYQYHWMARSPVVIPANL